MGELSRCDVPDSPAGPEGWASAHHTFFNDEPVEPSQVRKGDFTSLWAFQERLSALGHFHTSYEDAEHLKRLFRDQLDHILA